MNIGLREYLAASYSGLHLRLDDVHRARLEVVDALKNIPSKEDGKTALDDVKVFEWSSRLGGGRFFRIMPDYGKTKLDGEDSFEDLPLTEVLEKFFTDDNIVCLIRNPRSYFGVDGDAEKIALAADAIMASKERGSTIIFVGSQFRPAPELAYLVTVVDVAYPTQMEIGKKAVTMAKQHGIKITREDIQRTAVAASGLDSAGVENTLALSITMTGKLDPAIILNEKSAEIRKSDVLEYFPVEDGLDCVGGMSLLKEWVRKRKSSIGKDAEKFGLTPPKGILLVGIPGTGKSLAAKAISHELGWPCLRLDLGKVFRSYVGQSEEAIREALRVAEAVSPAVLWADEIEKGLSGANSGTDSGVSSRVVSTLLTWRQETKAPVFLACTANNVSSIPPEFMRHGRLDAVFATDTPNFDERIEIFSIHLKKKKRDPQKFDLKQLAEHSVDFVGAEIEQCILDALFMAFTTGTEITTGHILGEIKGLKPLAVRNAEDVRHLREWGANRAKPVSEKEKPKKMSKVRDIRALKS